MRRFLLRSISLLAIFAASSGAPAAVLYESGTLGPTGIPWTDLTNQTVPGTNVSNSVFPGVRFEFSDHVVTSQIGGHFGSPLGGTFFGAIVALDGENDFPDSDDLSTPDVLGTTLLTFPLASDEVFGDLVLPLNPGWYALVFGTGLFGATDFNGGAVRNGADIGDPTYISKTTSEGWLNLSGLPSGFENHRFVINGNIVPEPRAFALLLLGSVFFVLTKRRCQHGSLFELLWQ